MHQNIEQKVRTHRSTGYGCSDSRSSGLWFTNPNTKMSWVYRSGLLEYSPNGRTSAEGVVASGPRVGCLSLRQKATRALNAWVCRRISLKPVATWVYVAVKLMVLSVEGRDVELNSSGLHRRLRPQRGGNVAGVEGGWPEKKLYGGGWLKLQGGE
ncbi:unnamed protein product [Citrullus colocynthis]|uniref:Uncharacterized protein n=1 Tax=Citrullus colocynthis TaxID=252529 RepID=A0ABP0Z576_9ROSI